MDREPARSRGVSQTLLASRRGRARARREIAFDRLYRSSRDDVYAYAAGLLRDASAAEEVTATAFERAYRKRSPLRPAAAASRAPGSSGSPATRRSTSCAAAGARPSSPPTRSTSRGVAAGEAVEHSERRLALAAALGRADAAERELVALKFFAGLANSEIAARARASASRTPAPGFTER